MASPLARPRVGSPHLAIVAVAMIIGACGSAPAGTPIGPAPTPGATATAPTPTMTASSPAPEPTAPSTTEPSGWTVTPAASMLRGRDGFRVVVLGDGSVLAVGDDRACAPGDASPGSETAERFDPAADAWSEVESLNKPRKGFVMEPTADGGALVMGGINADGQPFSSTKVFEPASGSWTDGPLMARARDMPASAVMVDGRIVIASATIMEETSSTSTVEIYDATRHRWSMRAPIEGLSVEWLMALADGRLVAIGSAFESGPFVVVTDPGRDEGWHAAAAPGIEDLEAVLPLRDGGLLAFGYPSWFEWTQEAPRPLVVQRYDPGRDRWDDAASMLTPRRASQVTVLEDGRVLAMGGHVRDRDAYDGSIVGGSEIYDPATDTWTAGPDLAPRMDGHAVTLKDGSVLILGGTDRLNIDGETPFCPPPLTTVERLYPAP